MGALGVVSRALNNTAVAKEILGDVRGSTEARLAAAAVAERIGSADERRWSLGVLSDNHYRSGNWDDAPAGLRGGPLRALALSQRPDLDGPRRDSCCPRRRNPSRRGRRAGTRLCPQDLAAASPLLPDPVRRIRAGSRGRAGAGRAARRRIPRLPCPRAKVRVRDHRARVLRRGSALAQPRPRVGDCARRRATVAVGRRRPGLRLGDYPTATGLLDQSVRSRTPPRRGRARRDCSSRSDGGTRRNRTLGARPSFIALSRQRAASTKSDRFSSRPLPDRRPCFAD